MSFNVHSFWFQVKATNPLVDSPDPVDVALFCEKVAHESDGPQIATRLLAYRIHSPQEKEALHALAVLFTISDHSESTIYNFSKPIDSCWSSVSNPAGQPFRTK